MYLDLQICECAYYMHYTVQTHNARMHVQRTLCVCVCVCVYIGLACSGLAYRSSPTHMQLSETYAACDSQTSNAYLIQTTSRGACRQQRRNSLAPTLLAGRVQARGAVMLEVLRVVPLPQSTHTHPSSLS